MSDFDKMLAQAAAQLGGEEGKRGEAPFRLEGSRKECGTAIWKKFLWDDDNSNDNLQFQARVDSEGDLLLKMQVYGDAEEDGPCHRVLLMQTWLKIDGSRDGKLLTLERLEEGCRRMRAWISEWREKHAALRTEG